MLVELRWKNYPCYPCGTQVLKTRVPKEATNRNHKEEQTHKDQTQTTKNKQQEQTQTTRKRNNQTAQLKLNLGGEGSRWQRRRLQVKVFL